jgi:hypothetical protein
MSAPVTQFVEKVPRCIAAFDVSPSKNSNSNRGGHGEPLNSAFVLACPKCGGQEHAVNGYRATSEWDSSEVFISPLTLVCSACGFAAAFFDTATDGYDPEACNVSTLMRAEGVEGPATCACGGTRFAAVTCRFSYPDDLGELQEVQEGELAAENLFTWFSVEGRCLSCNKPMTIADFECA